jgi:Zn-dependent protease with chaperone function
MRIFLPPPASEALERLEAAAAGRPGRYRARLLLLAVAGDVLLTAVRVVPLAGPIVLGAIIVNSAYIRLLAAVIVLLLIWLMRPVIRDSGASVARQDAPDLFDTLDALKAALHASGRIEVRLDDEFNAGAREARGLFGILGTRRVLTLGVPLLALLGKDEARAIIAHEFGHFSLRHGRFGHWLYWAHLDWLSYATRIDGDSRIIDRGGAALAQIFAPAFSRRAMVWSRRCEYEADADAACVTGGAQLVSALARLAAFEPWNAQEFPRILRDWRHREPAPPDDFMERMIASFDGAPPGFLAAIAAREAQRSGDWSDTHPVLSERAAALGVSPGLMSRGTPAGPALLGTYWPTVVANWNARWRKEHAVAWSVAHARCRLIEAPLLAAAPEIAAGWPLAQQLDRAKALRRVEPARGLAALEALHAAAPDDRGITFACAAAWLAEGDASAVKILSALAKEDARWRVPAFERLARHCDATGDRAGVRRWARGLEMALESVSRAEASVYGDVAAGKLAPAARPAPFIATVHAGLAAEPAIARAWLVEGTAPLAGTQTARPATLRTDALIVVVDPFDAMRRPCDVDAVKGRQQQVLARLIEPDALAVVISFYTTEPLPAALSAALEKHPRGSAYRRAGQGAPAG